jgi:hypothetical protein
MVLQLIELLRFMAGRADDMLCRFEEHSPVKGCENYTISEVGDVSQAGVLPAASSPGCMHESPNAKNRMRPLCLLGAGLTATHYFVCMHFVCLDLVYQVFSVLL